MLVSFARQSVTVVEPSWIDDRGTLRPDYDTPVSSIPYGPVIVSPGASSEDLQARLQNTVRWTVYADQGVAASNKAGVVFDGVMYAIEGEAALWQQPLGGPKTVLSLVDWEG